MCQNIFDRDFSKVKLHRSDVTFFRKTFEVLMFYPKWFKSIQKDKSNFTAYIYMKKLLAIFLLKSWEFFIRFSCHALSEEVQTNHRQKISKVIGDKALRID